MTSERSFLLDELGDPDAPKGSKLWSLYASNEIRKSFYMFQKSGTNSLEMINLFKKYAGWLALGFLTWEDFSEQVFRPTDEGDPGAEKGSRLWSIYVSNVINESRQEFEQSSAHLSEMAQAFKEHAGWLSLGLDSWDKFRERYFFGQESALNEAIAASAKKIAPVDGLAWLAEQGAMFALPKGRTKSKFDAGWQNNPRSLDDANKHAKSGGNVGVLTGKHSGGIVAIDRDVDFPQTCEMLGQYAKTAKIARSNAKERGKLLYRITGEVPPSAMWKVNPTDKHPACEFLSTGRHALAPTSTFDGGDYMLLDAEYGIQELTVIELDYIWRMITGESIHKDVADAEAAQAETQVATEKAAVAQVAGSNEYVSAVKAAWTSKQIFEHFKRATHGTKKSGKDTRILGNAGLLVMPNDNKWYCHADGVGGGPLEAWAYCKWNKKYDHKMFWDVINDMAAAAGIAQPERKTKVYTNGNGNHAEPVPSVEYTKGGNNMADDKEAPQAKVKNSKVDVEEFFLRQSASDEGNAQCVKLLHGEKYLYCDAYGWMENVGTHWHYKGLAEAHLNVAVTETLIKRRVMAVQANVEAIVKATKPDAKNKEAVKRQFKDRVWCDVATFDDQKYLLNTMSGVVDLRNGKMVSHSPSDRFTYCINAEYGQPATSNLWTNFLSESVKDYEHVKDWLQMACGYSVTGYTNEEIMFYLFGPSRSGKGTFTNTFLKMLGSPLSRGVNFNMFTARREGDSQNFDLAPLKPCRFIAASESNKYQSLNEAVVKQITGNDPIVAAHKGHDSFTYFPQFKIWLSSNHPVKGDVDDDAFWGRIKVVEFPHGRLGEEDTTLKDRLEEQENRNALLAYVVEGSRMWFNDAKGLTTPESVKKSTSEQRESLDSIQRWLDECIVRTSGINTPNADLVRSYTDWCEHNGETPKASVHFGRAMQKKGFQPTKIKQHGVDKRGYKDIGIIYEQ